MSEDPLRRITDFIDEEWTKAQAAGENWSTAVKRAQERENAADEASQEAMIAENKSKLSEAELQEGQRIRSEIQTRYDKGQPYFTRHGLQRLCDDIDVPRLGSDGKTPVLAVRRFDGKFVDILCPDPANVRIDYLSLESLRDDEWSEHNPARLWQNIRLFDMTGYQSAMPLQSNWMASEDMQDQFRQFLESWKLHPVCQAVRTAIRSASTASKISKIIGFGLGSFVHCDGLYQKAIEGLPGSVEHPTGPVWQHALLLVMQADLEQLQKRQSGSLQIQVQDPDYNDADKAALKSWGMEVVKDPHGLLAIDDSTLVVSFCPGFPMAHIMFDICDGPAMMVWDLSDKYAAMGYPIAPRIKEKLARDYDHTPLPRSIDALFLDSWTVGIWTRSDTEK